MGVVKSGPLTARQQRENVFVPLQQELNKVIGHFYDWFEPLNYQSRQFENILLNPAMDIVDDKNEFKVELELPGLNEKEIKVYIEGSVLIIEAEKTTSTKDKDKNYMAREINYGKYKRSVSLPDCVDIAKAKASFKKGMLWVVFPKKPECIKHSRTLPIERAE